MWLYPSGRYKQAQENTVCNIYFANTNRRQENTVNDTKLAGLATTRLVYTIAVISSQN